MLGFRSLSIFSISGACTGQLLRRGDRLEQVHLRDTGMLVTARFTVTEPGFGAVDDAFTRSRLMDGLDERTREILRLRFEQDLTQSEIGERVGLSQMHVSRLIREALRKWLNLHHDPSGCEESRAVATE